MPRKKLIYTNEFPYHIMARSNNKESFYLALEEVWELACIQLQEFSELYGLKVYAFVLMSNHYHLLAQTSERYSLGFIMQRFQRLLSIKINKRAKRINHVFGGPYKASLIMNASYYATVYKYIYRNPVKAMLCSRVDQYKFSSLQKQEFFRLMRPNDDIDCFIDYSQNYDWLNAAEHKEVEEAVAIGLKKSVFKPKSIRGYR